MPPSRHADTAAVRLGGPTLARWPLPADRDGDKFTHGTALVIGGSPTTPGAVVLAGMAALRMGAGRLQIATAETVAASVAVAVPEALVLPLPADDGGAVQVTGHEWLAGLIEAADAVLIGPGMRAHPSPVAAVECVLHHAGAEALVVVDAAALDGLSRSDELVRSRVAGRLVLTPNRQEAKSMLADETDDEPDPSIGHQALLADIAERYGAVVTSFGSVLAADGRCWRTAAGHPSLGTSGSGDVLAGFVLGAAARAGDAAQAACWATFAHAAAGELLGRRCGALGFLARELLDAVVEVPELTGAG